VIAKPIERSAKAVALHRLVMGLPGSLVAVDRRAIERLRIAKGWSRRELAARVGIRYETVWEIETGRRERTDRGVVRRIVVALGGTRPCPSSPTYSGELGLMPGPRAALAPPE
jgi:transcriptional regulator with XRE-family HTH domain